MISLIRFSLVSLCLTAMCLVVTGCGPLPGTTESAIIGKWRHGLPEECPSSIDPKMYEELKRESKGETYYWEFFKNGRIVSTDKSGVVSGTYRFIDGDYVEITWDSWIAPFYEAFVGKVFKVEISGDKMTISHGENSTTFWRTR